MTPEMMDTHKTAETVGGFLKIELHSDRQKWWDGLTDSERDAVLSIPNFDAAKFKAITGIQV